MYIFELIAKLLKEKKEADKKSDSFENNQLEEVDYTEVCEHTFFPIDSTGEILACSKCGLTISSDELNAKPKNPFV